MKSGKTDRILVIGRRKPLKGDRFGGIVISFEGFLDFLRKASVPHDVLDVNWRNDHSRVWFLLKIYPRMAWKLLTGGHSTIFFHGSSRDVSLYALLIVLLGKITRKRVVLWKSAGDFDHYYEGLSFLQKRMVTIALKHTDTVLLQARHLVETFSWLPNPVWFPTVRRRTGGVVRRTYQKRFVYIGHIKESKGIDVILKAFRELPGEYSVHLYGPLFNYEPAKDLAEGFRQRYIGVLEPEEVQNILNQYDVLLLPSLLREGYPGSIIEAYAQGLPVVASRLRSISEIVLAGETGYLVEPGSSEDLRRAVESITPKEYEKLSRKAYEYFENFDRDKVMQKILNYL